MTSKTIFSKIIIVLLATVMAITGSISLAIRASASDFYDTVADTTYGSYVRWTYPGSSTCDTYSYGEDYIDSEYSTGYIHITNTYNANGDSADTATNSTTINDVTYYYNDVDYAYEAGSTSDLSNAKASAKTYRRAFYELSAIAGSNTSKDEDIYLIHYDGAFMDGEWYDIKEYVWLRSATGKTGTNCWIIGADGSSSVSLDPTATYSGIVVREMHFYESGHVGEDDYEVDFTGLFYFNDIDNSEGYAFMTGDTKVWANGLTHSGYASDSTKTTTMKTVSSSNLLSDYAAFIRNYSEDDSISCNTRYIGTFLNNSLKDVSETGYEYSYNYYCALWVGVETSNNNGFKFAYYGGNSLNSAVNLTGNTITYYRNYGTDTTKTQYTMPYSYVKLLSSTTFSRTGYTFKGWGTSSTGSAEYKGGYSGTYDTDTFPTIDDDSNLTLYAIWEAYNYEIAFDGNYDGCTQTMDNQEMEYGTAENLNANEFTRTGYTFTGWNTKSDGSGTSYTDKESVINLTTKNGGTVTLYAQWETNNYEIAFNSNGGSGSMSNQEMEYDVSDNLNANQFTRTGYTFTGWNTKKDGSGTSYTDEQEVVNLVDEDDGTITLYAQWEGNSYKVIYDPNGGTGDSYKESVTYGGTWTASDCLEDESYIFTKTCYTLKGWSYTSDGSVDISLGQENLSAYNTSNYTLDDDLNLTLYAVWEANTYNVTYDPNGGDGDFYEESVTYDSTWTASDCLDDEENYIFTRTGYTLKGWSYTSDGSVDISLGQENMAVYNTDNYTLDDDFNLTLYAVWKANSYVISFDPNGGDGDMDDQSMTYDVSDNLNTNEFTRTGYTFTGWNTESDGSGTSYTDEQEVVNLVTEDGGTITLYAQWEANTYNVVYDPNSGDGDSYKDSVTYDSTWTASDCLNEEKEYIFTKTGYTLKGWAYTSDGSVDINLGQEDMAVYNTSNYTLYGDLNLTLYAVWEANTYNVVYDPNSGTGDSYEDSVTYDSTWTASDCLEDESYIFTKTGYTLKGWSYTSDGSVDISLGQEDLSAYNTGNYPLDDDLNLTLYAVWEANTYNVIYEPTSGEGDSYKDSVTYDSTWTASDCLDDEESYIFTKTGYTLKGWSYTSDGSVDISLSQEDMAVYNMDNYTLDDDFNLTLYAVWEANSYTISFDPNGGDGDMDDQTMTYDVADNLNKNEFTRTGYTFTGWNTESNSSGTNYTDEQEVINLVEEAGGTITLYAVWEANGYVVSFDSNGGVGDMDDQSMTYDVSENLNANQFTRTNYTFTGWNTKKNGSGTSYDDEQEVANLVEEDGSTITLYAQWTADDDEEDNSVVKDDDDRTGDNFVTLFAVAGIAILAGICIVVNSRRRKLNIR